MSLTGAVFAFRCGIRYFQLAFFIARELERNGGIHFPALVAGERVFQLRQPGLFVIIAPEEEPGVGRVIIGGVKGAEFLITQVQHLGRIAAGIEAVQHVRKDGVLGLFHEDGIGRGIDALHFIEDHAFVAPAALFIHVDMPAFLTQDIFVDTGVEHRVNVDVHQIMEIPQVGAGYGITGLVRKGEGVEEGLERAFEQFDKGFLDRIFRRTAEHGVLQDMGHTGGIFGRRAETDAEALVFIPVKHGEQFRPGDVVFPEAGDAADFGKRLFALKGKAVFAHEVSFSGTRVQSGKDSFFPQGPGVFCHE